MTNIDSIFKSRDITLATKVLLVKDMVFLVVMYGCEIWTVKKAERRKTDAFELWCWRRLLKSPWDCKEIQPVHSKGDQSWVSFGRNDAKAETPVLWPPHAKSWLIGKDSDAGRDWGQEEKGTTEDEVAGWHHQLDGPESEWTPGVGDGQGGLACCDSWSCKESDTTERLNWTDALLLMLGGIGGVEKGTTEDEMAGWHHRLDGCESEWTPGVGDGQGGLACCDSWGHKESDTT